MVHQNHQKNHVTVLTLTLTNTDLITNSHIIFVDIIPSSTAQLAAPYHNQQQQQQTSECYIYLLLIRIIYRFIFLNANNII